jgi:hypothetical protein
MNVATPSSHAKTTLKEALAKREILILILVGALMFVASIMLEGRGFDAVPHIVLTGSEELGLSFIEAALVMAIIEMRASRERIEQSLALIRTSTTTSEALIAESIKESRQAAAQSQQLTRDAVENLFRSVYQKNAPKELVDFYESRVFRQNFFRRSDEYLTGGMLPGHGISLSWEPKLP